MTILPNSKKKNAQNQNPNEREDAESSSNPPCHSGHPLNNIPPHNALQANGENSNLNNLYLSPSSPHGWQQQNSGNVVIELEDIRNSHSSPKQYDEGHDGAVPKRRYRASPLRSVRPKLREHRTGSTSPPYPSTSNARNQIQKSAPSIPSGSQSIVNSGPTQADDNNDEEKGYNSGDEHETFNWDNLTKDQWEEKEKWFEKKLKKKNYIIKQMKEDGACLFRAIADQVYGDEEFHAEVRKHCMNYIEMNSDAFQPFVSESLQSYIARKRRNDCFGNHIEIAAMSEMYNRIIEVYCYSPDPINIFQGRLQTDNAPIRLSYHKGTHYNSIVDPYKPTIGVGLGLPNLQPGLAEKNLMVEATRQSENFHIEQTMLEDKIRATDYEATADAIEKQVAQQSYFDWLRSQGSSSGGSRSPKGRNSPSNKSPKAGTSFERPRTSPRSSPKDSTKGAVKPPSPKAIAGSSKDPPPSSQPEYNGQKLNERASFLNDLTPDLFGISDYSTEEADILAQVLAASQQEYLSSLKSNKEDNENVSSVNTDAS